MSRTAEELLTRLRWVDRLAKPINHALDGLLLAEEKEGVATPRRKFKNMLNGVWLGHPLHPMLVALPVGAWATAITIDLLGRGRGQDARWAAEVAVAAGLAGAGASAATGIADWSDTDGDARVNGFVHGVTMTGTTLTFLCSLLQRRRGRHGSGALLSFLGFGMLTVGGYLGGVEVYRIGYGVSHAAFDVFPDEFVPVMPSTELPLETPCRGDAAGVPIVLVRLGGTIHALADACTHMGCPLSAGTCRDGTIICPCHGAQFDLRDGSVVNGPASLSEPVFEVRERNGMIEVRGSRSIMHAPLGD